MLIELILSRLGLRGVLGTRSRAFGATTRFYDKMGAIQRGLHIKRHSFWLFLFLFLLLLAIFIGILPITFLIRFSRCRLGLVIYICSFVISTVNLCFCCFRFLYFFDFGFLFFICFLRNHLLSDLYRGCFVCCGRCYFGFGEAHLDCLSLCNPNLYCLLGTIVTQSSIRLHNDFLLAISALVRSGERLVLLVVHLPFDLIVAALAELVKRRLHDTLRQLLLRIERKCLPVLILLTGLLIVSHRHFRLLILL